MMGSSYAMPAMTITAAYREHGHDSAVPTPATGS